MFLRLACNINVTLTLQQNIEDATSKFFSKLYNKFVKNWISV